MSSLTRKMLPAFVLAAMMSAAQAQTATDQDHNAHHPDGAAAATQTQPAPAPAPQARPGTQPQDGQPGMMMNMDQMRPMMGRQGGMGLPFEHVEGRIAFLKAEIKITNAQTPQWNAFADTLRSNATAHRAVHEQMTQGGMPAAWPDRLAFQQKALSTRLDAVKALETAARPLYAVLTDEQKKLADKLLSGSMGMM